jgi:hypothetical protein
MGLWVYTDMAYLNCPFCPAQAFASLRTPSKLPADCGVALYVCISGHKFYVDKEIMDGERQINSRDAGR